MIFGNYTKRITTSGLLLSLVFLIFNYKYILIYSLVIFSVLSLLEFVNITKKIFIKKFYFYALNLIFILYIFLFSFFFVYFASFLQLKIILFSLLGCCIASDIGGFIFGKFFKGPKLTKISPNKTYAGSIGSLILSCLVISMSMYSYSKIFTIDFLIIGFFTSLACQAGDLFFSFLKRKSKIKDTGNFLPGHGGILDRVDGIVLGVPFGFIVLISLY
jgi:phosphatidate cytidylyltransferase